MRQRARATGCSRAFVAPGAICNRKWDARASSLSRRFSRGLLPANRSLPLKVTHPVDRSPSASQPRKSQVGPAASKRAQRVNQARAGSPAGMPMTLEAKLGRRHYVKVCAIARRYPSIAHLISNIHPDSNRLQHYRARW